MSRRWPFFVGWVCTKPVLAIRVTTPGWSRYRQYAISADDFTVMQR